MTALPPWVARHRLALACALAVAALAALTLADRRLALALYRPSLRDDWWYWPLRQVGDLRFWALAAGALAALERAWRRPAAVLAAAAAAGLVAELLKLVIGRERPVLDGIIQNNARYVWKDGPLGPLGAGFLDSHNLGIPSSHAAVAFGGAVALALLRPRLGAVALAAAVGCAMTRTFTGAHFVTDVLAGLLIGLGSGWALARTLGGTIAPRGDA